MEGTSLSVSIITISVKGLDLSFESIEIVRSDLKLGKMLFVGDGAET